MDKKEYFLDENNNFVPEDEATYQVIIEYNKDGTLKKEIWINLKEEELEHYGKQKCSRCS